MIKKRDLIKTPWYYVKKRLVKNKPAMLGMIFIIAAHIVALFGYLLMPDHTPYANDGSALIKKKPMGFKVDMLKIRKSRDIEKVNIFKKTFMGQESDYTIQPISTYTIEGMNVNYSIYGKEGETIKAPIINMVKPLFVGVSSKLRPDSIYNYTISGNTITYLNHQEEIKTITKDELIKEFEENNIEQRKYVLGTDKAGRDILSRLLYGTKISLSIGFISVLISLIVGVILGALAGFFGDGIDKIIMWFMTVVWSIPGIMLVIAISLALQSKGVWVAFVAVGLTMWVEVARVVRGQIMSIKEKLFVEAATALGIGNLRIIFVHILIQ